MRGEQARPRPTHVSHSLGLVEGAPEEVAGEVHLQEEFPCGRQGHVPAHEGHVGQEEEVRAADEAGQGLFSLDGVGWMGVSCVGLRLSLRSL